MADNLPWVKWHFDRWMRDEGLRLCSLSARGLWVDLLALMHTGKPYGHLSIGGFAPSNKQIAALIGMTNSREVGGLIQELENAGVFSRSEDGLIYSRRLVRDHDAREKGKSFGALGGNPNLKAAALAHVNGSGKPPGLTGGVNPPPKPREEKSKKREEVPPNPPKGGPLGDRVNGYDEARQEPTPENNFTGWDESGREMVGGYYLDNVIPRTLEAAGYAGKVDDGPIRKWLQADIIPDVFVPIIQRIARRPEYEPPRTLAYFDRAVREANVKVQN